MNTKTSSIAVRASLVALTILTVISCGTGKDPQVAASPAGPYGYGPDPNGSARYQPDVVIVRGGSSSIRSVSDDGLTWIIDSGAPGAQDLAIGKVMFVTSRAVGRVHALESRGADLAVTLEPILLTELVRDADIKVDTVLSPEATVFEDLPAIEPSRAFQPAFLRDPPVNTGFLKVSTFAAPAHTDNGDLVLTAPPLRLVASSTAPQLLPVGSKETRKVTGKVTVRDFDIEASYKETGGKETIGLNVMYKAASASSAEASMGLKFGAEIRLLTRNLRVRTSIPIKGGVADRASTFLIDGIEGLQIELFGGRGENQMNNVNLKLEVPIEILFEVPPGPETGGIPLVIQLKSKFLAQTAFGSKNSSMKTSASYGLSGPIGFQGGAVVTPEISIQESLTGNLNGLAMSVNGLVFALEHRLLLGVGNKMAMTGPYTKMVFAVGLTVGSALGMVKCRGATLKIDMGGGMGLQVSKDVGGLLGKILGKKISSQFDLAEKMKTMVNASHSLPDVPACRL